MRLTLVNPPRTLLERHEIAPPLGLLVLADAARRAHADCEVEIVDLNLLVANGACGDPETFWDSAVEMVLRRDPDIIGFTSMCVDSHIALELARRAKQSSPGALVVLGGPHFSAAADQFLLLYPWVDAVAVGEAEHSLAGLLGAFRASGANVHRPQVPGVFTRTFREPTRKLVETPSSDLPYDLLDLGRYFDVNPKRVANVEFGRGCKYSCTYCYSAAHFGRRWRSWPASHAVNSFARLTELGFRHAFVVDDNISNRAQDALDLCSSLHRASLPLTWGCYVTLADLSDDLIRALARAGCREVFIGVDVVCPSEQRLFLKRMFNGWSPLGQKLRACLDAGVTPTCAFLIGDPWRAPECVRETLLVALQCRLLGCGVRLNSLSFYNNTVAEWAAPRPPSYSDLKVRVVFDSPWMLHSNPYARDHPWLYPLHSTYMETDRSTDYVFALHTIYTLFQAFPMTLMAWFLERRESLFTLARTISSFISTDCDPLERRSLERDAFLSFCSNEVKGPLLAECFLLERTIADVCIAGRPASVDLNYALHDMREALADQSEPVQCPTRLRIGLRRGGLQICETTERYHQPEVHCVITASN